MTREWTARDILQLSGAYWASCSLQAGVQLDLFTRLHAGPRDESALATELGCNPRAFSMLCTALTALGFLERRGGALAAPEEILRFLSHDSPEYLGFIIKHHAHIMPGWTKLARAVLTGSSTTEKSTRYTEDASEREDFLMGMFNIARMQADLIADSLDLSGRKRLIDVGGGPGSYAIYFCRKNPELTATIFDLPTTEPFARKTIARFGLEDRVNFVAGNFLSDTLPAGYDVAWLSQVLHGESPEGAASLVKDAAACLEPGGLLCVQEFVLNDDRQGPEHAALFGLNMLVQTQGGQTYTSLEISDMLRAAGAARVRELAVALPQSCRVLLGDMP
ncbi:acetylserotonin O-methyltransferase [Desulfovibrio sp. OttesenSCG-928-A18]|nr:acetylserotonin O-methyltransferase [Desulfovibrio sp. OttesenSCG-928-A18]